MNVFFDVLDTLLTEDEVLRPCAREAFLMLREDGHAVYMWSSGGAGYAATAADLLGVADLVDGCFNKRQEPQCRSISPWTTTRRWWRPGYRIAHFDGDLRDEELLRVMETIDR